MIKLSYLPDNSLCLTSDDESKQENKLFIEENGINELIGLINHRQEYTNIIIDIANIFHNWIFTLPYFDTSDLDSSDFDPFEQDYLSQLKNKAKKFLSLSSLTKFMGIDYLAEQMILMELYRIIATYSIPEDNIIPDTHPLYKIVHNPTLDYIIRELEYAKPKQLGGFGNIDENLITRKLAQYGFIFFYMLCQDDEMYIEQYSYITQHLQNILEKNIANYRNDLYIQLHHMSIKELPLQYDLNIEAIPNEWNFDNIQKYRTSNYISHNQNYLYQDILMLMLSCENFSTKTTGKSELLNNPLLFISNPCYTSSLDITALCSNWECSISYSSNKNKFSLEHEVQSICQIIIHIFNKLYTNKNIILKCPVCGMYYTNKRSDSIYCSNSCRIKNHLTKKTPKEILIKKTLHNLSSLHNKKIDIITDLTDNSSTYYDKYNKIREQLKTDLNAINQNLSDELFKKEVSYAYNKAKNAHQQLVNKLMPYSK